jgi:hypothetical protein
MDISGRSRKVFGLIDRGQCRKSIRAANTSEFPGRSAPDLDSIAIDVVRASAALMMMDTGPSVLSSVATRLPRWVPPLLSSRRRQILDSWSCPDKSCCRQ